MLARSCVWLVSACSVASVSEELRFMRLVIATILDHVGPDQWSSHLSVYHNHLEGLLKHRGLGPTPRLPDSPGVG